MRSFTSVLCACLPLLLLFMVFVTLQRAENVRRIGVVIISGQFVASLARLNATLFLLARFWFADLNVVVANS